MPKIAGSNPVGAKIFTFLPLIKKSFKIIVFQDKYYMAFVCSSQSIFEDF